MPQQDEVTEPETPETEEVIPEPEPAGNQPEGDDEPLGPAGEKALEAFKERARKSEAEAKALEAKVKAFEDKNKTEQQRLADDATNAKKAAATAAAENVRLRVAMGKKLPSELIDRLQGETAEELEADADKLLDLVKPTDATDFDGGNRGTAKQASLNDQIVEAEAAGDWNKAGALKTQKLAESST